MSTFAGFCAIAVAVLPTNLIEFCQQPDATIDLRVGLEYALAGVGTVRPMQVEQGDFIFQGLEIIHKGAAVALLLVLLYFALFAFPRKRPKVDFKDGKLVEQKRARNTIYYICSAGMIGGFLIIAFYALGWIDTFFGEPPVFWGEAIALAWFGVAWLVKGRFRVGFLENK